MQFVALIYIDPAMVEELPDGKYDSEMRRCLDHADELRRAGRLTQSLMLEDPPTAKSIRVRKGHQTVMDGPFTETKELLAGFNLIEAADIDEAVQIAAEFPWAQTGCVEVRPVRDIDAVRRRVGSSQSATLHGVG